MTDTININGYTFKMTKWFQDQMSLYHKLMLLEYDVLDFLDHDGERVGRLEDYIQDELDRMIDEQAKKVGLDRLTADELQIWNEEMIEAGFEPIYAEWKRDHEQA